MDQVDKIERVHTNDWPFFFYLIFDLLLYNQCLSVVNSGSLSEKLAGIPKILDIEILLDRIHQNSKPPKDDF